MNKWLRSAFIMCCCLMLTGCWDKNEVKNLALVMATGIDQEGPGAIRVTVQTAVPSGVGGGSDGGSAGSGPGKSFILAEASGKNIKDADQRLQEQLPRKLYTAHRRIVVIGEDEAKSGLQEILDQFGRDPMNRLRDLVIVAKGETAANVLTTPTVIEKIPGQEMKTIEQQESGRIITMFDLLKTASSEGIVPIASAISVKSDPGPGEQVFSLDSTAIFKDLKLVGYLNDKETRGVMWVQGKIKRGYITAVIPEHGSLTLMVTSTNSRIQPVIKAGRVEFDVRVEGRGEIVENDTNLDISSQQHFTLIKRALDEAVETYIQSAYQKTQEYDADVFGFGEQVYRTHPAVWRKVRSQWDTLYKEAKLNLNVNIQPLRTGMSGPSLQLKQNEVRSST